jgi:hypothetical protein
MPKAKTHPTPAQRQEILDTITALVVAEEKLRLAFPVIETYGDHWPTEYLPDFSGIAGEISDVMVSLVTAYAAKFSPDQFVTIARNGKKYGERSL